MSNRLNRKIILRTIKGSIGRYIAILAIIALGVGFFAGIKVTKVSMIDTCDKYVADHNMYDYRFLSTYGFKQEDEGTMEEAECIETAEAAYSFDFFSQDRDGNEVVYRAHSITDKLNTLSLYEGRMAEASDECVVDRCNFTSEDIGKQVVVLKKNKKDTRSSFTHKSYTITGIVDSVYYLQRTERGTSSLGDGTINAFLYIPEEGFDADYYTEMYAVCREQGYVYSDEYNKNIKAAEGTAKAAAEQCGKDRRDEIIADAKEEIDKNQKKIDDGWDKLNAEKADAYAKLDAAKAELDSISRKLDDNEKTLDANEKKLDDNEKKLNSSEETLNSNEKDLANGRKVLDGKKAETDAAMEQALQGLEAAKAYGDPDMIAQAEAAVAQVQAGLDQIDKEYKKLESGEKKLKAGRQQIKEGRQQIKDGRKQIKEGRQQIKEGRQQVRDGYSQYYENLNKANQEFADAEAKLKDGQEDIDEAIEDLKELDQPKIYAYTREDNIGFDSFESNANIVNSIAKVFPLFFFLIAALVCSTTMSRMIEEERTQIGALRALGYSKGRIVWKYMVYSGTAAIIGCISGFLLGSKFFPLAIWVAYGMIFGFAPLEFHFSWPLALVSLVVALLCSAGTTWLACRGQLNSTPAEILRPKAPKPGKRIILERIRPLWSRMRFLHKVTARNILRYKKRMFMMVLGTAGCTALVLAGFGIYDSVAGMADDQYTEIETYDVVAAFDDPLTEKRLERFENKKGDIIYVTAPLQMSTVNTTGNKSIKSSNLMVTDDYDKLTKVVHFRSGSTDGPHLQPPKDGEALITNKLSEMMKVGVGDEITVKYDDTKETSLKVAGIYRNYVRNYIYITKGTFENLMGKKYEPEMAFIKFKDGVDIYKGTESINEYKKVMGTTLIQDTRDAVSKMMKSLDFIVWLVIACAGALALIVQFNLSNINITEREREIATIKVLGFKLAETGSYVFRETFILVILGILVGLPLGRILHSFIMTQIIVDMVAFNNVVHPVSYLYTTGTVIAFALTVDIIMRRKLRRINMAEALKSIE